MKTGELELHTRRVVWRYGKTDEDWRHFGYATVSFGDKPAGVYLEIVIQQAAEKFRSIDPQTANKIINDRYVDDITTGGSPSEVNKMAGKPISSKDKFKTDGTLPTILSKGSLNLKAIVTSGEENKEILEKLGNYVLGIKWDPKLDVICIEMESSNTLETILSATNVEDVSLTMRKILKMIDKPHAILGPVSPVTIKAKVAYHDLFCIEPALG